MDDNALNDLVDIEKRRDDERKNDRVNAIERAADLLLSRFDGLLETLSREALTDEDIEKLETKWEKALRDAIAGLRIDFKSANEQQSRDFGGELRGALQLYRDGVKDQQIESQTAIIAAIQQRRVQWGWWALGILAGLITSIGSTLFIVWLLGRP